MNIGAYGRKSLLAAISPSHNAKSDAEATVATEGLKVALNSIQAPFAQNLYILLDNQGVAWQLRAVPGAPARAPHWPAKKPQVPGPTGPLDAQQFHPDRCMSTGSLDMQALQGTRMLVNKQKEELNLPRRPPLLRDMSGPAELWRSFGDDFNHTGLRTRHSNTRISPLA